jgi:hypothetical protein
VTSLALTILEWVAGVALVLVTLFDVFQTVVVPRWTGKAGRIAPYIVDALWPVWRGFGLKLRNRERREDLLGTFAPTVLLVFLVAWVSLLILGYGLILHALRDQMDPPLNGLGTAMYVAGVTLFTIGYGDDVGVTGLSRVILLSAGAAGLSILALVLSLRFNLQAAFQRRETLVLMLDSRAGSPPSGVVLLETAGKMGTRDELPALFAAWERWSAEVLESHRAQPILPYFRSAHENESWISALGAVLDAGTLLMTTVDDGPQGAAYAMHSLGTHAVYDISRWFGYRYATDTGVERGEFDAARDRLARAGYKLRDAEESWAAFTAMRSTYAGPLNAMARYFVTPPAQWIGDRSAISFKKHMKS